MKEKTEIIPDKALGATTPEKEVLIPVKFNKEVRNLTAEEAAVLSQKGLKFEAIEEQWERLKAFALQDSSSTKEFLDALEKERTEKRRKELTEQCGGNQEMAEKIISLEKGEGEELLGEKEFKEYFPDTDISLLPQEVLHRARLNNANLLDVYLRYKARAEIEAEKQEKKQRENAESSVGSQKDSGIIRTPENLEFIRGLWNK